MLSTRRRRLHPTFDHRPETEVTVRSGHMGSTLPGFRGRLRARDGVFDGRPRRECVLSCQLTVHWPTASLDELG